jgi:hypothetical protein
LISVRTERLGEERVRVVRCLLTGRHGPGVRKRRSGVLERPRFLKGFFEGLEGAGRSFGRDLQKMKVF